MSSNFLILPGLWLLFLLIRRLFTETHMDPEAARVIPAIQTSPNARVSPRSVNRQRYPHLHGLHVNFDGFISPVSLLSRLKPLVCAAPRDPDKCAQTGTRRCAAAGAGRSVTVGQGKLRRTGIETYSRPAQALSPTKEKYQYFSRLFRFFLH